MKGGELDLSQIDKKRFAQLAQSHRLTAQVKNKLTTEIELLNDFYRANKIRQLGLTAELLRINSAFEEEKLDRLFIKGPVLSQYLYNDATERSSKDLDIFVKVSDIDSTIRLLSNLGYELKTKFNTPKQKEALIRYHHHLEFEHSESGALIELHWKLTSLKKNVFSDEFLWQNKQFVTVSSQEIPTLNDVVLLEYLCIHGTIHYYFRLQWLYDIYTLLKGKESEDFEGYLAHFESRNTTIFLLSSLALLHDLFDVELPENILKKIRSTSKVQRIKKLCLRELSLNIALDAGSKSAFQDMIDTHRIHNLTEGKKGLFRSLFARSVRPRNWKFFAFPDGVFFLNHLFSRVIWGLGKMFGRL